MKKLFITALCVSTIFASCTKDKETPVKAPVGITAEGKLDISNIVLFDGSVADNSLTETPLTIGKIEVSVAGEAPFTQVALYADGKASLDFAAYLSVDDLVPIRESFNLSPSVTISDETAMVATYALKVVYSDADDTRVTTDLFLSPQRTNTNVEVDGFFGSAILYCSKATQVKGDQVIDGNTINIDMNLRAGWNIIGGPVYFEQRRSVLSANNFPESSRWIAYDLVL